MYSFAYSGYEKIDCNSSFTIECELPQVPYSVEVGFQDMCHTICTRKSPVWLDFGSHYVIQIKNLLSHEKIEWMNFCNRSVGWFNL